MNAYTYFPKSTEIKGNKEPQESSDETDREGERSADPPIVDHTADA